MLNKISNLKLILGLVLLGLIYLAVVYFDSPKSVELEKKLVNIDTARVSEIIIVTESETVNLSRENQQWQVSMKSGKKVTAVTSKVKALLDQLLKISPDRLAAKDRDKWADYHVDSTGTSIKVIESGNTTLDMIVGQSGPTSYLRLAGEEAVYASDGFGGLNAKDNINDYRDNLFVRINTDSLNSISFNYPADSSFQIINHQGKWKFEDGSLADSAKTVNYLNQLKFYNNQNFAEQDGSSLGTPLAEIVLDSKSEDRVLISAYSDTADSVVYHSSLNQSAYFNDKTLGTKYFIGKSGLEIQSE